MIIPTPIILHSPLPDQLYTRSYELFKKWGPQNTQNPARLTLWIAYRIAQTYYESAKFDMAVRWTRLSVSPKFSIPHSE